MTSEVDDGSQWERVAAELRACREAQRRAWGDLDNATLGRYLAGDVDTEERRQIESALEALPELRKLTDLVRDVLSETVDIATERQTTPSDPTVLPFSAPRASIAPSRPTASWPTANWPTRTASSRFRQRVGLAAAACLLLALGVAFPRAAGEAAPRSELALTMSQPVAMRGLVFDAMPVDVDAKGVLFQGIAGADAEPTPQRGEWLARIDASVQALEADGKKHEAERLARQYADNLTRKARHYQEKGDLIRAEPALQQAHTLCARMWGPEDPETARTSNSLALVYEAALNTANPDGYNSGYSYGAHAAGAGNAYLGSNSAPPPSPYNQGFAAGTTELIFSAPMGDKLPAQYSSSSYESAAQPRSAPPGAKSAPRRTLDTYKVRAAQQAQKARNVAHHAMTTSSTAFVSLREHLTSQSQVALKTSVVPVLTKALREATSAEERQRLAHALGQLGPAARDAVPVLVDCCRHAKDASERGKLLLTFGDMGPAARQAVPVLVEALQNDSPTVRDYAARALVQLGPTARYCRTELVKQSADDPLVRDVLFRLDGPEGRCGIDDEVECFSLKAIHEAEYEIRQLASSSQIVLNVSTGPDKVARMPGGGDWLLERSDGPKPNDKKEWEKTHLRTNGEARVYFRIHKDTTDVQVFVSDTLQKRGLTVARLRSAIEPHLHKKDFDGGLREAVKLVARLDREHGAK